MTSPITPRCSLPGCLKPPVLQWQRQATTDEAAAYAQDFNDRRKAGVEVQRHMARTTIAQLQAAVDDPNGDGGMRHILLAQIEREQAALDAIPDAPVLPARDVQIAVLACEDHTVDDDKAAQVHEPHCLASTPCNCVGPTE